MQFSVSVFSAGVVARWYLSFKEVKMKKLIWTLLLVVLASEGCATIRGMGEDIQNLGRAVKRSVSGG
jgi:predicted small secreted protein